MVELWYFVREKKKTGPITRAQLERLALCGNVLPSDMVLLHGTEKWLRASEVQGLFSGKSPPPTKPGDRPTVVPKGTLKPQPKPQLPAIASSSKQPLTKPQAKTPAPATLPPLKPQTPTSAAAASQVPGKPQVKTPAPATPAQQSKPATSPVVKASPPQAPKAPIPAVPAPQAKVSAPAAPPVAALQPMRPPVASTSPPAPVGPSLALPNTPPAGSAAPVAEQWFILKDKKKSGPLSLPQLQQLAATGGLLPADMLLRNGTSKWLSASEIPGLFAAKPAAPAAPQKELEDEDEDDDEYEDDELEDEYEDDEGDDDEYEDDDDDESDDDDDDEYEDEDDDEDDDEEQEIAKKKP